MHERTFTISEICSLLKRAEEMGLSLESGELEKLTVEELEKLVSQKQ
jgi:hypothetical protein